MPNGDEALEFPTAFTEEDIKRLREIEEQRKAIERAYRTKFAERAWAEVPLAERAVRRVTPPWLAPVTGLLPGIAETLEFGFTPEQFQEQVLEIEEEFKELTRRQKVTELLPNIQADIMLAALAGEAITDTSELLSMFPELGKDFTEEEIGYLARLGQTLSTATPEQIMSGELFAYEPSQLPVTKEDMESLFREGIHDPRQVFATIEFLKDSEDVAQAMRDMYPPQVAEPDEAMREKLREYFRQRNVELGISPGETPTKEDIQKYHQKVAEEAGESLSLTNIETGEMFSARKMVDDTIWIGEDLIGSWDEETQKVIPLSLSGVPLKTEEDKEWWGKDWWDALNLSLSRSWLMVRQWVLNAIPAAFATPFIPTEEWLAEMGVKPRPELESLVKRAQEIGEGFQRDYLEREQNYAIQLQDKLKEHPELAPRPEWDEPMIDRFKRDPMSLLDAGYLGYQIAGNIHTYLAVGITIGVTYATHNPLAGLATAMVLFTPLETESLRSDLIAEGASYEQATLLAVPGGAFISSLEGIGSLPVLKAVAPQFFNEFMRNVRRSVARTIFHYAVVTPAKIITVETFFEEVPQEIFHNAFVKTVDENRDLLENVPETVLQSLVATAPLGFLGGGAEYINMKRYLPPEVSKELEGDSQILQDGGMTKEQSDLIAYNRLVETETGQAQVEEALEKAEEVPAVPGVITPQTPLPQGQLLRVTIKEPGKRQHSFWARVDTREEKANVYVPVDKEGEQITRLKKGVTIIPKDLIAHGLIVKEELAHIDRTTGEVRIGRLEPPTAEELPPAVEVAFKEELRRRTEELARLREELPTIKVEARRMEVRAKIVQLGKAHAEMIERAAFELREFLEIYTSEKQWALMTLLDGKPALEDRAIVLKHVGLSVNLASKNWSELTTEQQKRLSGEILIAEAKPPTVEVAVPSRIIKMETRLTTYGEDIEVTKASIEVQQARFDNKALTSSERLEAKGALDSLQVRLTELEADKKAIQKKVARARRQLKKVVEVPVAEEVTPEVAETLPVEEVERPVAPDRRPKLREWGDEEVAVMEALDRNPIIARAIKIPPKVAGARVNAETVLNRFQDEYQEAKKAKNKEAIKEVETKLKDIAKEAGFRSKALLGKRWGDLPPDQQTDLALSSIPDRSIHLPGILELADVKHYVRFLEEETGLPFYQLYPRIRQDFGASQRAGERVLRDLKDNPMLREVRTNKESQVRATQQINSKNPRLNVQPVEDLNMGETVLVDTVEDILKHYEPYVRYLRVEGTDSDIESFRTEFPDAVEMDRELELQVAIDLKEANDYDGLWSFVNTVDWGVITGYTPWMKAKASIFPRAIKLGTTRGEARLMARSSIEFDETLGETLLLDVVRYVKQIEAQWRLRTELEVYEDMWQKVSKKFTNARRIENKLKMWGKELQGMPVEGSIADNLINRVWKQSMSTVFVHLYMSYRNIHQPIAFHPDRTELVRLLAQPLPLALNEKGGVYYDNFVTQLGGIRSDFLLAEGKGIPGLGWITNVSDRVSLYAHSDNIPRQWSFKGSTNKAWRATQEYRTSNKTARDLSTWVRKSGVNHLTQTEKNYALQLLAQGEENINLAVPGLGEVSGYESVSFYLGHEMADITHFIYRRAFRAPAEMGATGRLLYNLIVFPRSYAQRIILQSRKVGGIFHSDTNWEDARAGFKDVLLLLVMGGLVSEWLKALTGKERRAYNALEIIQWQLGGLAIGVGIDVTEMFGAIWTVLDVTASEEDRDRALGALPGLVERNAQVLVPFYRYTIDAIEAAAGVEDIGVHSGIRKLRGMLDKDYTPTEIEEKERTLWEAIRHAVLGSEPQDPTEFQDIQTSLRDNEARLGELDATGRYYTIGDFGNQIASSTRPLPDYSILEEYGFSSMVVFYMESSGKWEELYKLPSTRRNAWRKEHIYEEAMLLFWEKYSSSVFVKGSPEAEEIMSLLRMWFDLYGIDRYKHGHWADWTLPIVPEEEE